MNSVNEFKQAIKLANLPEIINFPIKNIRAESGRQSKELHSSKSICLSQCWQWNSVEQWFHWHHSHKTACSFIQKKQYFILLQRTYHN